VTAKPEEVVLKVGGVTEETVWRLVVTAALLAIVLVWMVTPASEGVLVWMVKPASVGSLVWMPTAGALVSTAAALLVTSALLGAAAEAPRLSQAALPALWALARSEASQDEMRQGPASLVSSA
jgi:hypothetical protein